MLKSELKRCTKCGEVFEATAKDDQDLEELNCPYLDCDGEGTIETADWADRFDRWMADRMKTYIYVRGKVKVQVKNLYYIPLRRYNGGKRKVKRFADWLQGVRHNSMRERAEHDLVDNFGYSWREVENMTEDELLDAMYEENQDKIQEDTIGETDELAIDGDKDYCPNCHKENPEELAKSEGEYRCERCIMGGFN